MQDTVFDYLQQLVSAFSSLSGVAGVLIGLFLLVALAVRPGARWVVLSLLLFVSTFAVGEAGTSARFQFQQLPFPLDIIRVYSRILEVLITICMIVPLIRSRKGWRTHLVPWPSIIFFILNIWVSLRIMSAASSLPRGMLSLASYLLIFGTLALGIGRSLQTIDDAYSLMKSLAGTAVLFVLANVYYALRNPESAHGRFWGITPNPQSVGQVVAFLLPPLLCVAHYSSGARTYRKVALWATAGFMILFLLWSGSRAGLLMVSTGVLLFYRVRIHRAALVIVGAGIAVFLGLMLLPDSLSNIERFTDTTNTRAGAWSDLYDTFVRNPMLGDLYSGNGYGESFFLATLAYYGIIGGIPVALLIFSLLKSSVKLLKSRKYLAPHGMLVDVVIAHIGMTFITMIFESGMLGVWNYATLLLFIYGAMIGFIADMRVHAESGVQEEPVGAWPVGLGMPVPQ